VETSQIDQAYMKKAIDTAKIAEENGDVPIGAVIIHQNTIIVRAYDNLGVFRW
jgi:tRNA(Arg) A34 adenosine deaminase TadA